MKKRLFLVIMIISVTASAFAFILSVLVYYDFYVLDVKNQLKTIVELSSESENWNGKDKISSTVNKILNAVDYDMRLTVINERGDVVYDNWANRDISENHKDRPEITQAFDDGIGENTRYSHTMQSDMYYYALKINDSEVLRASRKVNSINSMFERVTPMLLFLFAGLLILVYIAANSFTRKIMKPVNQMAESLDEMLEGEKNKRIEIYDEFEPLSFKIREQKVKINRYIEELKYERDTIGMITENMREGFILINSCKHILSINASGKCMAGNENFNLDNNRNIMELTRNFEILKRVDASIKQNKHIVYDMAAGHRCFRYYFSPVIEQQKQDVTGLLILIEDVTIQKDAETMRSEFSANVSHELKTPLTTMIGFAEMIKEGLITDPESIKKYCGMINDEGLRLIAMIEDIIRLSKIEGADSKDDSLVNLNETATEVISLLQLKADSLNVKLNLQAGNVLMKANKNYISELLYNLVDNSIKYNKNNGSVNIYINKTNKFITIKVKDTGVGIAEEHQDRIFERFYRVDKSRFKETGGTGLGLSIVKHITELYGGTVQLKSREHKGTEITIKFPVYGEYDE